MISIAVHPTEQRAVKIGDTLANYTIQGFKKNGLKNIFVVFSGKEVELFYQMDIYDSDYSFRIDTGLPLSFSGETLLQINEHQFDSEEDLNGFVSDLIKNIHYIKKDK